MKLLLSLAVAVVVVLVPVSAEAKSRPSSCTGVITIDHKASGKKVVDRRMVCGGNQKTVLSRTRFFTRGLAWG